MKNKAIWQLNDRRGYHPLSASQEFHGAASYMC